MERYLDRARHHRRLSAHTVAAYRGDLAQFLAFCDRSGVASLADIDRRHVRRFLAHLDTRRYARRSIARKASAVRAFFADATRRGELPVNPADQVARPKRPTSLPHALPQRAVREILESVDGDDPLTLRDRALLEVLYATGLRVSEASGITVDDIEGADRVRVIGKGGTERVVPLGIPAQEAVAAYLPLSPESNWRQMLPARRSGSACGAGRLAPGECVGWCGNGRPLSPMRCATPSQPICSRVAPTCVLSRRCSATANWGRHSFTLQSPATTSDPPMSAPIREHDVSDPVHPPVGAMEVDGGRRGARSTDHSLRATGQVRCRAGRGRLAGQRRELRPCQLRGIRADRRDRQVRSQPRLQVRDLCDQPDPGSDPRRVAGSRLGAPVGAGPRPRDREVADRVGAPAAAHPDRGGTGRPHDDALGRPTGCPRRDLQPRDGGPRPDALPGAGRSISRRHGPRSPWDHPRGGLPGRGDPPDAARRHIASSRAGTAGARSLLLRGPDPGRDREGARCHREPGLPDPHQVGDEPPQPDGRASRHAWLLRVEGDGLHFRPSHTPAVLHRSERQRFGGGAGRSGCAAAFPSSAGSDGTGGRRKQPNTEEPPWPMSP